MFAAIQPIELPVRAYSLALGGMAVAAFVVGGAMNFVHATRHPGADPYKPAAVETVATPPQAPPVLLQPAQPPKPVEDDEAAAALVAQRSGIRSTAARREPMHCIDQVSDDGRRLGVLCQRDPGGVKGSTVGSIGR